MSQVSNSLDLLLPQPQVIERGNGVATAEALSRVAVSRGTVAGAPTSVADEAYELTIRPEGARIVASAMRGERHARTTLSQLAKLSAGSAPCCTIRDWPALKWRGFMNDCGRNFLDIGGVRAIIDMMAAYKMNLFHWHLSDYHGWRLESKIFPQLNRPGTMLRQVGKYYTQDEFREMVAYAAERGVTIMPELDVPGHTLAFRRGMGIDSMDSPGIDKVISELLDELCSLVPADAMPFVHIGTDEVRVNAEYCDKSWTTLWARTVNAAGRKAVVWAPGEKIDPSCDVIDMAWYDDQASNSSNLAIDAARMYNASWTPFDIPLKSLFIKPCRWDVDASRKLGAITCTWHDDNVGDDTLKLFRECAVFPSIVAMADNFWHGRDEDRPDYAVRMPPVGSAAFARVEDMERRMAAQRDVVLADFPHPFPFMAQTKMRWRVTDMDSGETLATDVALGTVRLCIGDSGATDCGNLAGAVKGRVAAETWIYAPVEMDCGAWIDLASVNGVYGRLRMPHTPDSGEWNAFKGKVELNGVELPPPQWRQPGMKSKTKSVREQDVPYSTDLLEKPLLDEMPALRDPYPLHLKAGWNHLRISMEMGGEEGVRAFSFIPILGTSAHPREVQGLEYRSSEP
jgi:hypothetical protein